jgi:hypothetical protein
MTAQFNDLFRFGGSEYALAGISEGKLFEPSLLDLQPVANCTACWRGYQAIFAISKSHLVLDTLRIYLSDAGDRRRPARGPAINGVEPSEPKSKFRFFNNHYKRLNYHLEYSGGLLLGAGFIDRLYVHMGFHPAWKYRTVIELVFENGILRGQADLSEKIAEVRKMILESQQRRGPETARIRSEEQIRQFIERAFDRSYNRYLL